jgi:hypothetical protein
MMWAGSFAVRERIRILFLNQSSPGFGGASLRVHSAEKFATKHRRYSNSESQSCHPATLRLSGDTEIERQLNRRKILRSGSAAFPMPALGAIPLSFHPPVRIPGQHLGKENRASPPKRHWCLLIESLARALAPGASEARQIRNYLCLVPRSRPFQSLEPEYSA